MAQSQYGGRSDLSDKATDLKDQATDQIKKVAGQVEGYASDAMDRVAHAGKQIVNALAGYSAPMEPLIAAVGRVREDPGVDTVGARRRIADAAITRTRYPF